MADHLRKRGVTIRTSTEVKEVMVADGRVAGVVGQRAGASPRPTSSWPRGGSGPTGWARSPGTLSWG